MLRGVDARAACARAVCGRLKAGSIRLSLGPAAKLKSGRARLLKLACNGAFPHGLARGVEGPRDAMFSRCGSLVAIDVCAQAGVGVIGWMSGERTSSFVNAPSAERSYGGRHFSGQNSRSRFQDNKPRALKALVRTIASLQNDTHTLTDTHTQRTVHTHTHPHRHMLVHTHPESVPFLAFLRCWFVSMIRCVRVLHPCKSLADWSYALRHALVGDTRQARAPPKQLVGQLVGLHE